MRRSTSRRVAGERRAGVRALELVRVLERVRALERVVVERAVDFLAAGMADSNPER
jgi:hypothetical protein